MHCPETKNSHLDQNDVSMITCFANIPFYLYFPSLPPTIIGVPQNLTVGHFLLFQTRDSQITDTAPEVSIFMSNCTYIYSVNKFLRVYSIPAHITYLHGMILQQL